MGRMPDMFAGQKIKARFPYLMNAELTVAFSTSGVVFQDVLFTNQADKPFEIHRLIPRVVGLDNTGLVNSPQADQDLMNALVRLDILDFRTNQKFTKAPCLILDMVKGSAERTWEFAEPYTLPNSGGFQVAVSTLASPTVAPFVLITQLSVQVCFEGFLLQVAAPSDSR